MFFIEFKNNQDSLTLPFKLYNTDIAVKWFNCLKQIIDKNPKLKENDRLYQFPNDNWTVSTIIDKLNEKIDIINSWEQCIPMRASGNQETLNSLHKFFENLRGGVLATADFFVNAPANIQTAVSDFNVLIHRLEDLQKSAASSKPRIVVTFEEFQRFPLDDADYNQFTLDIKFGEVYINYCEVGKPLWDVYRDRDEIVGDNNIRPLRYYSAEMQIAFCNGSYRPELPKFWSWFDSKSQFLSNLGFIKYDKHLSLGNIPVAKLETSQLDQEIINSISKFKTINRVFY
jgi:hypothetical protein